MNAATIDANAVGIEEEKTLFERIIDWRVKHISDNQFVLLLAFIVGILAAFAASVLHLAYTPDSNTSGLRFLCQQ